MLRKQQTKQRGQIKRTREPRIFCVPRNYKKSCPCLIQVAVAAALIALVLVLVGLGILFAGSLSSPRTPMSTTSETLRPVHAPEIFALAARMRADAADASAPPVVLPDGLSSTEFAAIQRQVPGTVRSVSVIQLTEDKYFLDALIGQGEEWCRGAVPNIDLVRAASKVFDLATTPIFMPEMFLLKSEVRDGLQYLRADDRARLLKSGVSAERIEQVADTFADRTDPNHTPAVLVVHTEPRDALPVVNIDERRTVIAAIVAPAGAYRADVLYYGIPVLAASMLKVLGGEPRKADEVLLEYWFEPWSQGAQNVKYFALRYCTQRSARENGLKIQHFTMSKSAPVAIQKTPKTETPQNTPVCSLEEKQ